ncbi:MAG TPA: hypothetical protein VLZ33_02420 [Dysgonamonadaceae bacterium]|nr:hypothetical protein [Dysgonamonadaceae bacterium]
MIRLITPFVIIICAVSFLTAQENNSTIDWEFTPTIEFDGMFKSKFEYADRTNETRFSVRNSRLGIQGDVTPFISYRAMAELSQEGEFKILDLYSAIAPIDGLSIKIGQIGTLIHTPYTSPDKVMFANMPFICKYFTDGPRDIGVSASYNFKIDRLPVGIEAGLYNGGSINNPVWTKKPSISTQLILGTMKGLRGTAKLYKFPKSDLLDFMIYATDLRYEANSWKVETEFMYRKNKANDEKLASAYLQGAYWFPLQNTKVFKNIITAARWDAIGRNETDNDIDVNRLTLGLGFSFTDAPFQSLVRIDYEFYNTRDNIGIFIDDVMDSNKLSVELLLTF